MGIQQGSLYNYNNYKEVMMEKVIRENKEYLLITGVSVTTKELCYQIINKNYGVVEIETTILPQAIKYFGDLSAGLVAVLDMEATTTKESIVFPKSISGLN